MARTAPESIGALIPTVLQQTQHEHGALFTIQRQWNQLLGKRLAQHTKPASLRRGRLVIYADGPGESFLLSYERPRLLKRLHTLLPGKVDDIVVRPGER